ncbi:ATP-dependent DNA ligase [Vampirovibrio sp.]|uniref:ATP-dependent DNA ligase n=1 Tax=Vampirovibrio sp. TaxID=2717857 RepID=UPI003593F39A
MKAFLELYEALDSTTSTNGKVEAMVDYFKSAPAADCAWAVFFLSGRRIKRLISSRMLTLWFEAATGIPDWLFRESYMSVGDTAETIALLNDTWRDSLPLAPQEAEAMALTTQAALAEQSLAHWMNHQIKTLETMDEQSRQQIIIGWWRVLDQQQVFMVNKLLSGAFRVGVSQRLLMRALSEIADVDPAVMAHRLMGHWEPSTDFFQQIMSTHTNTMDISKPYPFFLAYPVEQSVEALGPIEDWLLEWKWDGIRAQCVVRQGEVFLWSRGEELLAGRFPELEEAARRLPDGTVLDGEILAFSDGLPLPFSKLQTRIGRKKITPKVMADVPVVFMAYDLLEWESQDIRTLPLSERKAIFQEALLSVALPFLPSPPVPALNWAAAQALRQEARQRQVEGFVIKRLNSTYQSGRKKGDWWKWKVEPLTIDAVLIYAQAGTGRRANFFTDYTFAVWRDDLLVPVAKAYSGLSNEEIERLDRWIRGNTKEKFGPVRSVEPYQVFELGFEGISESKRHKSGVALRFPRILRWREDKPMAEADTLETLKGLLHAQT